MSLGKKILAAFVEVAEEPPSVTTALPPSQAPQPTATAVDTGKFVQHFERLFAESNHPGPDYYEFAKMVDAMTVIPDEKSRYLAAFAGLSVQGLNKERLVSTAAAYLAVVDADVAAFQQTLEATLQEKVAARREAMDAKATRIGQLTQEITALHNEVAALQQEISESEEKIRANSSGYQAAAAQVKTRIAADLEKIRQHLA